MLPKEIVTEHLNFTELFKNQKDHLKIVKDGVYAKHLKSNGLVTLYQMVQKLK